IFMEVWRDISGYEGKYQVSSLGRVKSLGRKKKMLGRTGTIRERILVSTIDRYGRPRVNLFKNGKPKNFGVHVLVARAFIYKPLSPEKLEVNHINGIKDDNRVENLEWCTRSENIRHAWRIGLIKKPVPIKYE